MMKPTNHEAIKLILTATIATVIGTCFFVWETKIKETVGYNNYYIWLSYCSVFPPVIINKIYDWVANKIYDKTEIKLASEIDDDVILEGEADSLIEDIKDKNNDKKRKLEEYKNLKASRKTI